MKEVFRARKGHGKVERAKMQVRYLSQEEKERSRSLWEECFPEDSARFLDYYYREKCRDNRILVLEEEPGGRILSMVHQNPYLVRVPGGEYSLDYLVGVATAAHRRHRGYMRTLLKAVMQEENRRRMPFSFLMPANPRIYEPFDFVYVFDQPCWQWNEAGGRLHRETAPVDMLLKSRGPGRMQEDFAQVGLWLDRWLAERYQIYALRTEAYMERMWKELVSEQGKLSLAYDRQASGQRLVGMEAFWGGEDEERRFLYGETDFVEEAQPPKPAIMARIVNLEEFMKGIGLREGGRKSISIILGIRDEMLEENCGVFQWDICGDGSRIKRIRGLLEGETEVPIVTIGALTRWLLGGGTVPDRLSAMSAWALDFPWDDIAALGGIFLDEVV